MSRGRRTPPPPDDNSPTPWTDLVRQLGYDPAPVATERYAASPRAVEVALAACLGHPSLCVRRIPDASAWLLRHDLVAVRVEGADWAGVVFDHLAHGKLCVIVIEAEGARGAMLRVYTLHAALRAEVAAIWAGLTPGVAAALEQRGDRDGE